MRKKSSSIYIFICSALVYMLVSIAMFPFLEITVMIYSVPLTMLGGWYFSYSGANITTLLTIPFHYILLNIYSDDPLVVQEAFNPFGIGTQIVLSNATALLKRSRDRYNQLNESLEIKVAERTSELENLANYLFSEQQKETAALTANLLKEPYENLQSTLKMSERLLKELTEAKHHKIMTAKHIHQIISDCIKQLHEIENHALSSDNGADNLKSAVLAFIAELKRVSSVDIQFVDSDLWNRLSDEEGAIYGIITEAITNALKHAKPSHIEITAHADSSQTIICIENDGLPFAMNRSEGMGVPLMRYRAEKIGASISIDPIANRRTRIQCRIPDSKKPSKLIAKSAVKDT